MTPDVVELCLAGERAFKNDEFEEAAEWYELACTGAYRDPFRPVAAEDQALIDRRFERRAELRRMMRWRNVQRLAKTDPGHVLAVQTVTARLRRCHLDLQAWGKWQHSKFLGVDGMNDTPLQGQAKTFFDILRRAANVHGFTALTLLEDDVVLAKNALDYIATAKIDDDLAFISWFSVETCEVPRVPPILVCYPALGYMFNQCITFPARTVHELLASDALKNWNEVHGADRIYEKVFPEKLVAVHYPSLVQHVGGQESLVGNNSHGLRVSPTFPGEDFDALSLIR